MTDEERLITALSFGESPVYTEMIKEIDRLAAIEVQDAISSDREGERRAHAAGRAQSLMDLVDHFEKIREQVKERMKK